MTDEEKLLLLKDLCARLSYGVKGLHRGKAQRLLIMDSFGSYQVDGYDAWFNLYFVEFKPYLRPMSSMTDEEWLAYCDASLEDEKSWVMAGKGRRFTSIQYRENYLNAHHFDYRGLIPMGLALEAPEGMYKTE